MKYSKPITIVLFLIYAIYLPAQHQLSSYSYLIVKADLEFVKGNRQKSAAYYRKAFESQRPFIYDIQKAISLEIQFGDKEEETVLAYIRALRSTLKIEGH